VIKIATFVDRLLRPGLEGHVARRRDYIVTNSSRVEIQIAGGRKIASEPESALVVLPQRRRRDSPIPFSVTSSRGIAMRPVVHALQAVC